MRGASKAADPDARTSEPALTMHRPSNTERGRGPVPRIPHHRAPARSAVQVTNRIPRLGGC